MTLARIKKAIVAAYSDLVRHHTLQVAAALSHYFVLAIFPALIFLSAVMGSVPLPNLSGHVLDLMARLLPAETMRLVESLLLSVLTWGRSAWLPISVIMERIWSCTDMRMTERWMDGQRAGFRFTTSRLHCYRRSSLRAVIEFSTSKVSEFARRTRFPTMALEQTSHLRLQISLYCRDRLLVVYHRPSDKSQTKNSETQFYTFVAQLRFYRAPGTMRAIPSRPH
jgi:Virulence factor BrkB